MILASSGEIFAAEDLASLGNFDMARTLSSFLARETTSANI